MYVIWNSDVQYNVRPATISKKKYILCVPYNCGVKKTFGMSVYSKEYTFPILSIFSIH
jgi:hypothetical protein